MGVPLNFTIRQLQYFVAVAEHGTMGGAAEACFVTQSTISLAISELEQKLGVELFLRPGGNRSLKLTKAGSQVLGDARRLLDQLDEFQAGARNLGREVGGRLVVGIYETLTPYIFPYVLREFRERFPSIKLDLIEGSISGLNQRLLSGECEVVVTYQTGDLSNFDVRKLYSLRPHVILPSSHPLAGQRCIRLVDLESDPLILLDMPPSISMFERHFARAGVTPDVVLTTSSPESVRALVAGGVGYSLLLNRSALPVAHDGHRYAVAEIYEDVGEIDVVALTPRDATLTRRAQSFLDCCAEVLVGEELPGASAIDFTHE